MYLQGSYLRLHTEQEPLSQDDNVLRTKRNINLLGRSFMLSFTNGSSGASFTLLQTTMTAKARSLKYRLSTDIIG